MISPTRISLFALLSTFSVTYAAPASPVDAFPHDGFIGQEAGISASVIQPPTTTSSVSSSVASATASSVSTQHSSGKDHIVIFDTDAEGNVPSNVSEILNRISLSPDHADVKYTFDNGAFKGFVASFGDHCINQLNNMTEVAFVEEALSISSLSTDASWQTEKQNIKRATQQRSQATWGLQRISSSSQVNGDDHSLDFTYSFDTDPSDLGKGVDIYVVDTGVNVAHSVFGGRAQNGFSFTTSNADGDGHGTHVAGTAAGAVFGVASGANIWAVKVLGDNGAGSSSDTIAGMDWVISHVAQRKKDLGSAYVGAVMSMSWGLNGKSSAIETAVKSATDTGIHVSVAAGNSGKDSCTFSPSGAGGSQGPAITVGSIGISDKISSFSNNGACNDVYAPGENVLSAWNTAANTINFLSGTSMACPHVTGVMAYLMARDPTLAQDPAKMKQVLKSSGLSNVASGTVLQGDAKVLVNNGQTAAVKRSAKLRRAETRKAVIAMEGEAKRGIGEGLNSLVSSVTKLFGREQREEMRFVLKRGETALRW
jgi:cerevisin